jgi:calcineurin-like phosphoesterase family protein
MSNFLVHISDTHNKHEGVIIPECEFLVHSGDFTNLGKKDEVEKFLTWFSQQNGNHKILISGNHDKCFDSRFEDKTHASFWLKNMMKQFEDKIIYLENSGVENQWIKILGLSNYSMV